MTISTAFALLVTMILLALTPDTSVIAVVARSLYSGIGHGLVTIIGLLCGDFIFILIAISGLSAIANSLGNWVIVLKLLGGGYLIYLGIKLWQAKTKTIEVKQVQEISWLSNFLCGFLITMSDPKAILFYVSFLPTFLDLANISTWDVAIIMLNATIALGGVKLSYAYMANRVKLLVQNRQANQLLNYGASIAMIASGMIILFQA